MKIAVISEWFSENMGYAENMLPKALVKFGNEVHVISSTAQIYFSSPNYRETYESFLGPNIVADGTKCIDGFTLHRLPLVQTHGMPGIRGLKDYLIELNPEIIQTFDVFSDSTYDAAIVSNTLNIKLFTASHIHASVFRYPRTSLKTKLVNLFRTDDSRKRLRLISGETVRCYAIAPDAARIVHDFYRLPESKIKVESLGVDTNVFYPMPETSADVRRALRSELHIQDEDVLCIYTGRFAKDKQPQCLAEAVDLLQKRAERVFGLFVGKGTQEETREISCKMGCVIKNFVRLEELPRYYWAADIGVWPAQESTSQLDAMACGLPLILSDKIEVTERVEGNGLLYHEGNAEDLAEKISKLKNVDVRSVMSKKGIKKIQEKFSWDSIARRRLEDYSFLR